MTRQNMRHRMSILQCQVEPENARGGGFKLRCLSVCLSVRHTFLTMFQLSYHHEIFRLYYQRQK